MTQPLERRLHRTTSLCGTCKNGLTAEIFANAAGEVWMRKTCATHGPQQVKIAADVRWYEATRAYEPASGSAPTPRQDVKRGCPFDCGPCKQHTQKVRLPVVTITSACNLNCPICYVHNKNDGAFHMAPADFQELVGHLVAEHGRELDLINFTGGEPTMHPHFLEFLEISQKAGIHRVAICTNGIRLAREEALVEKIAKLGGRVALSFDSFEKEADIALQGASLFKIKKRCLELLAKYDVDTTLIPVMTKGINDHEIGKIIDFALTLPNVRHIEVHLMTYTGQGGASFSRKGRITTDEVLDRIVTTAAVALTPQDFVPSPCAHPLCYQICYLLMDRERGTATPLASIIGRDALYEALGDRLYLEPSARLERSFQLAIDRLWIEESPESERLLVVLKDLLSQVYPSAKAIPRPEAIRRSERFFKAIYVHSHMDEETFDAERVAQCCDSNVYPDGKTVPVCSYNVLYREKEAHFMAKPREWNERSGGRMNVAEELA